MCVYDDDGSNEFQSDRYVRARKEYRCAECHLPIPIGNRHLYSVWKFDGSLNDSRIHQECADLAERVGMELCGESQWGYEQLVEHLQEMKIINDRIPYKFGIRLDLDPPLGSSELRYEAALAWEAIQHKYGGGEPDFGGEA